MIQLPAEYNYVAAFLTLACNLRCTYCINRPEAECRPRSHMNGEAWVSYLNQLDLPDDLPVTLQGGEPSLHPDFYGILQGLRKGLHVDLLTNLGFDVERFAAEVPPSRFLREAPYPSIRVTYHPGQSDLEKVLAKISFLKERGYSIGLYSIRAPGHERLITDLSRRTGALGVEYRTKEYLGLWRGKVFGTYHYPEGVFSDRRQDCLCRTTELLIAPDGKVFRCHRDLYVDENSVGRAQDGYLPEYAFRPCKAFGECNPCDLKRKTNRFQSDGHASVEIHFSEPHEAQHA